MRKVDEYFGQIATYGADILYTIMKGAAKILTRPVKATMGDDEVENMLLGREILEWVYHTSKMSVKMGQVYTVILKAVNGLHQVKFQEPQRLGGNFR